MNTTRGMQEEINDRIKRPQVNETKSRKLEDDDKQKKFRELCELHSIVSALGDRINDAIDLI